MEALTTVVRSPEVKRKVREIAVRAYRQLLRYIHITHDMAPLYDESRLMVESTDKVSVLLLVFGDNRPYLEQAKGIAKMALKLSVPQAWRHLNLNLAAGIYPAVQNILLSAKSLGLGTCLTTSIILREKEVKRILQVPQHLKLFALIYLGYPAVALKPPKRRPMEDFTHYDVWGSKQPSV